MNWFLLGVGAFAAFLAWLVYVPENKDVGVCPSDFSHPSSTLLNNKLKNHDELLGECYFSKGYDEATKSFLRAAKELGAETSSMPVTDTLSTKVAIIRGNPEHYVIHISGTHGPESYAGSAVQIAALEYLHVNKVFDNVPEDQRPTVVFVHALNPYGFKTGRRVNENNIDLNRNFLTDEQWTMVKARDSNYAGYDDLDAALNPKTQPFSTITQNELYSYWNMVYNAAKYGVRSIKKAMVSGNYHNSKGFGFGGFARSQSAANLIDLVVNQLQIPERAKHVVLIDVHTGLGPSGVDTLLALENKKDLGEAKPADIGRIFPIDYDERGLVRGGLYHREGGAPSDKATSTAENVNAGYEETIGTVSGTFCSRFLAPHLDGNDRVCVTQEFGTRDMLLVGKYSLQESYAYQYGSKEEQEYFGRMYKSMFYVERQEWKRRVVYRGLKTLLQGLEQFGIQTI